MDRITQNTFWEQEGGEKDYFAGTSVSRSSRRALENFAMNPGRNLRSVWTINPYPTKDVHFATFPPNLIKPMILASTSEYGCCAECGAPYIRIVEKGEPDEEWKKQCGADSQGEYEGESKKWLKQDALGKNTYTGFNKRWKASQIQKLQNASNVKRNVLKGMVKKTTIGWAKTCSCKTNEIEKPLVLDIFAGSGTIGIAAGLTGRDFVGIEINPSYIKLAEERIPREITKIRKKEEKERKLAEKEEKIMETLTEDEIKLLKKIKLKLKHPNFKDTDTFNQTVLFSD
jgi:16S rRNA G966 N2-methylase RsmD